MKKDELNKITTEDKQITLADGAQLKLIRITEAVVGRTLTETIAALQLVLRDGNLPPELFDYVYRAELGCRGTMAKVNAVIELYGGEDAASAVRTATYDMTQFFTVVCSQMNKALGHKYQGHISFDIDEESEATVSFDARRVSMILYHLIANAVQHGRTDNKNVEIRAFVKGNQFEMSVRDRGGGIPEAKRKTLFLGFTQALDLQRLAMGPFPPMIQGIGLPLCKKLAEDMRGALDVKNYKTGAKFILQIPQYGERMREISVYQPDDTLLKACMADLLAELNEKKGE